MSGETVYRVRVQAKGAEGLDALTQAAVVAKGALEALNKVGGAAAASALSAAQLAAARSSEALAKAAAASAAQMVAQSEAALKSAAAAKAQSLATVAAAQATHAAQNAAADAATKAANAVTAQARAARESAKAASEKAAASGTLTETLKGVAGTARSVVGGMMDMASRARDVVATFVDMATEGAKLKTLESAFNALGGSTKQLEELRRLTGGLVSDADLQQSMSLAKLFKLPEEEVPKLIKLAQGASAALGTTVGKALQDTFTAASRQSKMIADNMGIVIGDMGKMYEEFARKRGKTTKELTDSEKTLAFTQKMIAEGGRQMELANIAQGNSAMKAAAAYDNFKNKLLMSVATAADGMGIWDMLGGAMSQLEGLFNSAGGSLSKVLGEAFKAFLGILSTVAKALAPAVMSIEGLGKVMHILGGVLQAVAPGVQTLIWLFQKLSSFLLDVVSVAVESIIRAAATAASIFDEDLSASLTKAADEVAKARDVSLELGTSLDGLGEAAAGAAPKVEGLGAAATSAAQSMSSATGSMSYDLMLLRSQMQGMWGWGPGKELTEAQLKEMGGMLKYLASEAQASGMTMEAAQRHAAEELAKQWGVASSKTKEAADVILETQARLTAADKRRTDAAFAEISRQTAAAKAEEQRARDTALAKMDAFNAMYASAYEQGSEFATLTDEIWLKAANDEKRAAEELEAWRLAMLEQAAAAYGQGTEQYAQAVAQVADTTARAFDAMALGEVKEKKSGGGRSPRVDYAAAEYEARLALAEEGERKIMEIETRYQGMLDKLRADDHDTRIALTFKMADEIVKAEEDAAKARAEINANLQMYFLSETAAAHQQRLAEIRKQADEMRAAARAAGGDEGMIGAVDARERELIEKANRDASKEGFINKLGKLGKQGTKALTQGYQEGTISIYTAIEEATKSHTERMAQLFQRMGDTIAGTFISVAMAGADMREATFKMMGQLFGQLSTAFLAWASAESALLKGNPIGGALAAVALGMVASAISAFGARKPSGGGGSSASTSRKALEMDADEKGKKRGEKPTIIYAMGFATPDSIAGAVRRGGMRGAELDGRGQ